MKTIAYIMNGILITEWWDNDKFVKAQYLNLNNDKK